MRRADVIRILKKHRSELRRQYGVKSLSLFGSVARDEARSDSDVDLLVEFDRPVGLFAFIGLQQRLESLLGCKVDLGHAGLPETPPEGGRSPGGHPCRLEAGWSASKIS